MGLTSLWNISFLGYPARAILPYCQALSKLSPHMQQVAMESNGKGVDIDGNALPFEVRGGEERGAHGLRRRLGFGRGR
jgi:glucose-6-phosphate isomerase